MNIRESMYSAVCAARIFVVFSAVTGLSAASAGIAISQVRDERGAPEEVSNAVVRQPVVFDSGDEAIRGWLYLSKKLTAAKKAPAIVTANALTGIKEINLPE